jgi:curved DNA-binding protein CbpA
MRIEKFVNFYEILEVDPYADATEIEHKFRKLARRYHPDNQSTGNRTKFDLILLAHDTLRDAGRRAEYHRDNQALFGPLPPAFEDGDDTTPADGADLGPIFAHGSGDGLNIGEDIFVQNRLLTILYLRRRKQVKAAGMGDQELEELSGCPPEHMEFHLWYLKEKGWISTGDDGLYSITMEGIDHAAQVHRDEQAKKLITDQS